MQATDPVVPPNAPQEQLHDVKGFLDQVIDAIATGAAPEVLDMGNDLWYYLALIVVVWTGARVALTGDVNPWELVRLVVALAIPKTMLYYYANSLPGMPYTFPTAIAAQGTWLQSLLVNDVVSAAHIEFARMFGGLADAIKTSTSNVSIWKMFMMGLDQAVNIVVFLVASIFFGLMFFALYCLTYAQVLWAHIAISIAIILGPMFIPWLVFQPMAFLFWGWFRTLLTYSLYAAVAGAILRIWVGIGLGYVSNFTAQAANINTFQDSFLWGLVLIPLCISGILAALKVGEFSSLLISGAGATDSGFIGVAGAIIGAKAARGITKAAPK